jgi:LacI family transcriptional regulator
MVSMAEPTKRATIKDVAREAGVSFSLASQVLRGDPSTTRRESTRVRIFEAARLLNYQHHAGARALRTGKTNIVGVISPATPIIITKVETEQLIVNELNQRDYRVAFMGASGDGGDHYNNAFEEMLGLRVEGVIVHRVVMPLCADQITVLQRAGVHVVAIGSSEGDPVDGLREDDRWGTFEATSHLIRIGHRRIMFLGYLRGEYVGFPLRLSGYKEAMAQAGLPITDDLLVELKRFSGDSEAEVGYEAAAWTLAHGTTPDAIVCSNDEVALGAMRAIYNRGLTVPEDIALVGFDDIVLAGYGAVPLTTVAQPKQAIAETAVDLLCKRIKGELTTTEPQFTLLKPRLVIRESCGARLKEKV